MSAFDNTLFWPEFAAAGLLSLATVRGVDVRASFHRPNEILPSGVITTEYQAEYQTADLPKMKEGDAVTIWTDDAKTASEKFKVRQTPLVQGDGFFSIAILTKL